MDNRVAKALGEIHRREDEIKRLKDKANKLIEDYHNGGEWEDEARMVEYRLIRKEIEVLEDW